MKKELSGTSGHKTGKTHNENISSGYSVRIARSVEEVEEMRPVWEKMQCSNNTDIDIYLNDLKFIDNSQPYVILLFFNGLPQAMMVGRLVKRSMDFKIGYKTLYKPRVSLLSIVYTGIVGEQSYTNSEAIIAEIINALNKGEADMVTMHFLRLDSDIYGLAKKKPGFLCRDYISDVKTHSKINLPGSMNEFLVRLKSKHKRYYNRHFYSCDGSPFKAGSPCRMFKKLEKKHQKVTFKCFQDKEDVDLLCSDAEEVAQKTYQRGLGTGFFYNREKARRAFLAWHEWQVGYVLYVNDKPCAFWIGSVYGKRFLSEFLGFDPAYKKYEPGTILLMKIIDDFCENNIEELDFGVGEASYKKRFGDEHWEEESVYIFAPTLKGIKLNFARTATSFLSQFAERMLNRFDLLTNIKRAWRDRSVVKLKQSSGKASF